jgi:chorismate synthase
MIARIDEIRRTGNSIGGVVEVVARNVPAGLGSPVFDKLEAELAKVMWCGCGCGWLPRDSGGTHHLDSLRVHTHPPLTLHYCYQACMSLPASKGFEIGSGFGGTLLAGFDHNDEFYVDADGRTRTRTNRSGGVQGGISNGENIVVRVAFKPTSTIGQEQKTVSRDGVETTLRGKGRHDPCVLPRAVPMVESMVALVLVDALMQQVAQNDLFAADAGIPGANVGYTANPLGKKLTGYGIASE